GGRSSRAETTSPRVKRPPRRRSLSGGAGGCVWGEPRVDLQQAVGNVFGPGGELFGNEYGVRVHFSLPIFSYRQTSLVQPPGSHVDAQRRCDLVDLRLG